MSEIRLRQEWGVLVPIVRSEPSFTGSEESARYLLTRPTSSIEKYATDECEMRLVRRWVAEWEDVTDV